jgi:hypothetical protein
LLDLQCHPFSMWILADKKAERIYCFRSLENK